MVNREFIIKSIDNAISKCTYILKSSVYYGVASKVSEDTGLSLYKCKDDTLIFKDEKNNTTLDFSGFLERTDLIDFTGNTENSMFSLSDVVGFYNNAPSILKNNTNLIHFENYVYDEENYNPNDMEQFRIKHKGLYQTASRFFDAENNLQKTIRVTPMIFDKSLDVGGEWNVERAMLHEMFHCLDYRTLNEHEMNLMRRGENIIKPPLTQEEYREYYELYSNHSNQMSYSADKNFGEIVSEEGLVSNYAISYYENSISEDKLSENFADIGSVVAFAGRNDKSNAKLRLGDETLSFDEIKERFPNTFAYMLNLVE